MAVVCSIAGGYRAAADDLDWSAWQRMPVSADGRLMPLDTFARDTVEAICGSVNPTFLPPDSAGTATLFPGGKPRTFSAPELLFSWLVEPEQWKGVAFLAAGDKELRTDVLDLPLADEQGRRLSFVTIAEAQNNRGLGQHWAELERQAQAAGQGFRPKGVEKRIKDLVDAYAKFDQLTFDPRTSEESSSRFFTRVRSGISAWQKLAGATQRSPRWRDDDEVRQQMAEAGVALQKVATPLKVKSASLDQLEPPVAAFRRAAERIADRLAGADDKALAAMAADLRRQTIEIHLALYDSGESLRLVPALNPGALEENRTPNDDAQPWLGVQTLLGGSAELLRGYPQAEVEAVRTAFAQAKAAYLDRAAPDRAAKFADAMQRFATAVRTLGESLEPAREKLPILRRDQDLINATAYPPPGAEDLEVFYNRLDPFFWAWTISLAAMLCLALSFGAMRTAMFWLGAAVLALAQAFTVAGFAMRADITRLVPLTGMFETVVFVALWVALLGLWFAVLPLLWPGLQAAWRMTAVGALHAPYAAVRVLLLLSRLALTALVFLFLVRQPNCFGYGIFDLLPPAAMGAALPSANDVLVWLCGLGVLLTVAYYVPRFTLTLCVAAFTVAGHWQNNDYHAAHEDVLNRRLFVLGGAALSCLSIVLACYAPATVMHRQMGSAAPILRDNFWLVVHVVTIMASYAAAAIALILGNIALGHYLFGRYRTMPRGTGQKGTAKNGSTISNRRPPETCATLAGFTYTAIKITVLLLTAGTILGALWADKAWGRFWAWDPKEVWALISLLVYVAILHARCAGWSGNFGMAAAAVLGASAVLFTWYGVNFLLNSGMHAYGSGSGGQWQVATAVGANWLFLILAAGRYFWETAAEG